MIFSNKLDSNRKKVSCLGGCHYRFTVNQNFNEKVNPKTQKFVKIVKDTCSICVRNISQTFTE